MAQISFPNSSFSFLTQGAIIQEFSTGGHNLVLSCPTPDLYLQAPFFGETIGRVANRISKGLIHDLNGQSYQLATNLDGVNHLHGGSIGWGRRTFSEPQSCARNGRQALRLTHLSPHGEEGYPGTVELNVYYSAFENDDRKTVLDIEYEVNLVGTECEETVVNVTNHTYFNLSGDPTIDGTEIILATSDVLDVDENSIPTGDFSTLKGLHANQAFKLGATEPVVDHCFVMDKALAETSIDTRSRSLQKLVSASHTTSGVHLEVFSTEPAFQFYTGDYVDVPATEQSPARMARSGFCVEPGRFINAVNMPEWRDQVVLRRGQTWGSRIVYKAWKE